MRTTLLKAALFTPLRRGFWGLPLLCWAEPGCAKTDMIVETAAKFSLPCEVLSPSERGEGAFGVVPVPSGTEDYAYLAAFGQRIVELVGGKSKLSYEEAHARALKELPRAQTFLTYPAPEWVQQFVAAGRGVVFVDEITSTPPALQAPLMGLFLARRIGGTVLPKKVRMIAAANPVDIAAGGYDLAAPLANRMGHIDWTKPSVEEHVQFMLRGEDVTADEDSTDAADEERRVLGAWGNAWARAVGYETAFLQKRPGLKNQCPKAGDPKASRAWPSDRSWEFATRALASAEVHGLSDTEREVFVASFIGEGPSGELFTFIEKQDLPDPADLLDGKVSWSHDSTRLDRTVAVLAACTALVTPRAAEKRKDRAVAMWGLLQKMTEKKTDLDILVPATHALIDAELHAMVEAARPMANIQPVLRAAGITPSVGRRR